MLNAAHFGGLVRFIVVNTAEQTYLTARPCRLVRGQGEPVRPRQMGLLARSRPFTAEDRYRYPDRLRTEILPL